MSDRTDHIIIDDSPCPSLDDLMKYKESELDTRESYMVEKHLLSCSICDEVIGHLSKGNLSEMTALAVSIDQQVGERISLANSGNNNVNFNAFMFIAAVFIGVLMIVGNLFINDDAPVDPGISVVASADSDEVMPRDNPPAEVSVAEYTEEGQLEGEVATLNSDPAIIANDNADTLLEKVLDVDGADSQERDAVGSKREVGDTIVSGLDADPTVRYLQAIIDAVTIEKIGEVLSSKGSTNKKVKIKSNQGYAPELEGDEGYPLYPGGEKKLKTDIVKGINDLQLALGQGGEAEIVFRVSASGTIESIKVDEEVSLAVVNQLTGVIGELSDWIPGNVAVQYTVKVALQ